MWVVGGMRVRRGEIEFDVLMVIDRVVEMRREVGCLRMIGSRRMCERRLDDLWWVEGMGVGRFRLV